MKIDPLAAAPFTPARPTNALQAAQWRQALDQALWSSRQIGKPHPTPPTRGSVQTLLTALPLPMHALPATGPASPATPETLTGATHHDSPAWKLQARSEQAQQIEQADLPLVATAVPEQAAGPSLAPASAVKAGSPAELPIAPAKVPPQPKIDAPRWPPFASQASLRGNQVSAAVRDARLSPRDMQTLRRGLARQLGAAGLELAELRINGQTLTP